MIKQISIGTFYQPESSFQERKFTHSQTCFPDNDSKNHWLKLLMRGNSKVSVIAVALHNDAIHFSSYNSETLFVGHFDNILSLNELVVQATRRTSSLMRFDVGFPYSLCFSAIYSYSSKPCYRFEGKYSVLWFKIKIRLQN